jgi:purine-binding chemotaxis protein CheW
MSNMAEMSETAIGEKYLIFSVSNRLYSFPAQVIGEVANCDPFFHLPLLPSYVIGVIDRYSVPYALFDISLLLTNTPGPRKEALVINKDIDQIAFSIENVAGIANITPDKLNKIETGTGPFELHNAVYASFKWNGEDVYILNIRQLLARIMNEAAQ